VGSVRAAIGAAGRVVDDFVEYVAKVKLEIVVPDLLVEKSVTRSRRTPRPEIRETERSLGMMLTT